MWFTRVCSVSARGQRYIMTSANTSRMKILLLCCAFLVNFLPVFKTPQTETSCKFDIFLPRCVQPLFRWCPATRGGIPLPSPGPYSAEDGEIRLRHPGDKAVVYLSGILTPSPTSKQCCRPTARPHGRDETMKTGPAEVCESTRLSSATCRRRLTTSGGNISCWHSSTSRVCVLIWCLEICCDSLMRTLTQN